MPVPARAATPCQCPPIAAATSSAAQVNGGCGTHGVHPHHAAVGNEDPVDLGGKQQGVDEHDSVDRSSRDRQGRRVSMDPGAEGGRGMSQHLERQIQRNDRREAGVGEHPGADPRARPRLEASTLRRETPPEGVVERREPVGVVVVGRPTRSHGVEERRHLRRAGGIPGTVEGDLTGHRAHRMVSAGERRGFYGAGSVGQLGDRRTRAEHLFARIRCGVAVEGQPQAHRLEESVRTFAQRVAVLDRTERQARGRPPTRCASSCTSTASRTHSGTRCRRDETRIWPVSGVHEAHRRAWLVTHRTDVGQGQVVPAGQHLDPFVEIGEVRRERSGLDGSGPPDRARCGLGRCPTARRGPGPR